MPISRLIVTVALAITIAAGILAYSPGLEGPFLLDDHPHISQNRWIKIDKLGWDELVQAWNSSVSPFPANRPLAQVSFGLNHAVSGLDPFAFKATNLALHVLNGILVFVLCRLVFRASNSGNPDRRREVGLGLFVMAIWLLHPLHVSTVLYAVQRMTLLSALGVLAAMVCYVKGRFAVAEGRRGIWLMYCALPATALGFLGKENAVLLPLFLLVLELTVLRPLTSAPARIPVRMAWGILIALPLLVGTFHILTTPNLWDFSHRPFSLEDRLMTQARVIWIYLKWLFIPDVSQLGLFHDDIPISRGLTDPPTTLIAVVALVVLLFVAIFGRRSQPLAAFAVLFFFAGHALESTFLPLEIIFEHRNYLPSLGPMLLIGGAVAGGSTVGRYGKAIQIVAVLLIVAFGAATFTRAQHWSSFEEFVFTSAEHHPDSPRANFLAGQVAISLIPRAEDRRDEVAAGARHYLNRGLEADPRCLNCRFGLLVLDLHLEQAPEQDNLDHLVRDLRNGPVDASILSISQFNYLVEWAKSGDSELTGDIMRSLFDAALDNPGWNYTGRAGIESTYREYLELVVGDLESALTHARAAVAAWPSQWSYHKQLIALLLKMGRKNDALSAVLEASRVAVNAQQQLAIEQFESMLRQPGPE